MKKLPILILLASICAIADNACHTMLSLKNGYRNYYSPNLDSINYERYSSQTNVFENPYLITFKFIQLSQSEFTTEWIKNGAFGIDIEGGSNLHCKFSLNKVADTIFISDAINDTLINRKIIFKNKETIDLTTSISSKISTFNSPDSVIITDSYTNNNITEINSKSEFHTNKPDSLFIDSKKYICSFSDLQCNCTTNDKNDSIIFTNGNPAIETSISYTSRGNFKNIVKYYQKNSTTSNINKSFVKSSKYIYEINGVKKILSNHEYDKFRYNLQMSN